MSRYDQPTISDFTNANHTHKSTATGGLLEGTAIWTSLTAAYASGSTFTFTGTDSDVGLIQLSLFTCTNAAGTKRRIGYIKSSVNNTGTITATVVSDTDLVTGDIDFKVAYNRKIDDYLHLIRNDKQTNRVE